MGTCVHMCMCVRACERPKNSVLFNSVKFFSIKRCVYSLDLSRTHLSNSHCFGRVVFTSSGVPLTCFSNIKNLIYYKRYITQ